MKGQVGKSFTHVHRDQMYCKTEIPFSPQTVTNILLPFSELSLWLKLNGQIALKS